MREVSVDKLLFRPSVYGVIIKDKKILLVPQWDGYDFPGGGVELGETMDEALVREVKEETGLTVLRGPVLLCENNFFIHPYSKKPLHTILAYYQCTATGGEISDAGFDEHEKEYAKKAEWVDLDRIGAIKFLNPIDSPALIKRAAVALR